MRRIKAVVLALVLAGLLPALAFAQGKMITTTGVVYVRSFVLAAAQTIGWSDAFFCRAAASTVGLGGCTSSFPALRRSSATLEVRLGDDSAYTTIRSGNQIIQNGGGLYLNSGADKIVVSGTAPSAPASCGTSPAVTSNNGTAAWVITGGTGGAATGCTVTMPAATTGWNCSVVNITAAAAHRANVWTVQTASTTTSVTWEYQTVSTGAATIFTASDVFRGSCFAY